MLKSESCKYLEIGGIYLIQYQDDNLKISERALEILFQTIMTEIILVCEVDQANFQTFQLFFQFSV